MISNRLINFRDVCYVWAMRQYGESGVEREYKIKFKALFVGYYMTLFTIIGILNYKAGNPIPTPKILEENVLVQLVFGLLMLCPYNFLMNNILKKISPVPIDKDMSLERFRLLLGKFILFFIIGLATMFLVPWSMDRLLPSFN